VLLLVEIWAKKLFMWFSINLASILASEAILQQLFHDIFSEITLLPST